MASCGTETLDETLNVDILITNVLIHDGINHDPFTAHVGISDGRISFVKQTLDEEIQADTVIEVSGAVLAPGFIDMHGHGSPGRTPEFENFLAMGVTTVCLGQDGSGPDLVRDADWESLFNQETGVNIIYFSGHGTIRELSGAGIRAVPTAVEMDSMKILLDEQLNWTFGLSTGLEYAPGMYAGRDELISLAEIVGNRNRLIMSHMRNEDDGELFTSIRELAGQGRHAPVHISHLKSVYGKGRDRAVQILDTLRTYREKGISMTADIYPYTASYTGISIVFPEWSKTESQFEEAKINRRPELQAYLRERIMARNGPEATLFGTAPYAGKTLADLQAEWGIPFEDILIDSIGPQGASAAYFVMDDTLQATLIADSLIAICSDGSPTGFHPRGHGTHARIIEEFVMKRGVLTLPEAIRKMTSYPAHILGLKDRGEIKEGYIADLVLFRPADVHEKATFEDPFQLAEGFSMVIVNGKIARTSEKLMEGKYGEFIKPVN